MKTKSDAPGCLVDNKTTNNTPEAQTPDLAELGGLPVRLGRAPHGYTISQDHAMLYDLALVQPVVCFLDYGPGVSKCRDVAITQHSCGIMQISVRGMSYIWADKKADFLDQCMWLNVEFILPNDKATNHPPRKTQNEN